MRQFFEAYSGDEKVIPLLTQLQGDAAAGVFKDASH